MIKTEEQRRWWFATHPELSWSHKGGGSRGYEGGNKDSSEVSPKDVDSYVDEALKYETGTTAELLKALKSWFGTEFESKTPEEQHALLWGDDEAAANNDEKETNRANGLRRNPLVIRLLIGTPMTNTKMCLTGQGSMIWKRCN